MLDHPNWVKSALLDPSKMESSFSFALHDTDSKINRAIYAPYFIYGKECQISCAQSYMQHRQCERCFMLTHSMTECHRPADYK